jgi:cytoskeleton protein RodZ
LKLSFDRPVLPVFADDKMALDTGEPLPEHLIEPAAPRAPPSAESLAFAPEILMGAGLRAVREFRGLSIQDIADITKIRRVYLAAVEAMDLSQLPSRPFAIGYVRAYAGALGIDAERAVAKFKADAPEDTEPLRPPVGVSKEADPRVTLMAIGGVIVLAAIVIWNVAQRAMRDNDTPPTVAIAAPPPPAPAPATAAPVALGSALPPPVEATVPAPYVTPGLPGNEPETVDKPEAPRVQGLAGAVYGAPADQSSVTLQAVHNITLIVHSADGKPYAIQVLKAGESYRAPNNVPGLSLDISEPQSVDLFVNGEYKGALSTPVTQLSSLMK